MQHQIGNKSIKFEFLTYQMFYLCFLMAIFIGLVVSLCVCIVLCGSNHRVAVLLSNETHWPQSKYKSFINDLSMYQTQEWHADYVNCYWWFKQCENIKLFISWACGQCWFQYLFSFTAIFELICIFAGIHFRFNFDDWFSCHINSWTCYRFQNGFIGVVWVWTGKGTKKYGEFSGVERHVTIWLL